MTARLRVRRSKFAGWSRWLGVLSVPVLVIAALARHLGLIDPPSTIGAVALGSGMGVLAVILAVAALVGIWRDGRLGLGDAVMGLIPGLIASAPIAFTAWAVLAYPRLNDISTDSVDPPLFLVDTRAGLFAANSIDPPPALEREAQQAAYPDIASRRFPIAPALLFEAARLTVKAFGWTIVREAPPGAEAHIGIIQTEVLTRIFALPDDVVIRVMPDPYGARMDIRSASRYGAHDLGTNAQRIRAFFAAADDILVETLGQAAPDDGDATPDDGDEAQPAGQ